MKLDKKKKIQLIIAGGILALLLIIIFSLNSTSKSQLPFTAPNKAIPEKEKSKTIQTTTPQKPVIQKNSQQSTISQQQKVLDQELQSLMASFKNLEENVKSQPQPPVKKTVRSNTPAPRRTPTPAASLSPLDRQASQSAVFFPGGAPKPVNTSSSNRYNNSKNSSSSTGSSPSDQKNDASDDMNSDKDSSTSNNDSDLSSMNNGYDNSYSGGGGGGFIPIPAPTQAAMTLQYSPSADYDFSYTEDVAGPNPLDEISTDLTLTITVNNPTYSFTTISFCNSQFASCLNELELSSSSLTITTSNVGQVKPSVTNNSYISTSITIDDTSTNYMVPRLYFLLSTSDNATQIQASASFPVRTDCTSNDAGNIATCTVTNSSTTTMNITVSGTNESSS